MRRILVWLLAALLSTATAGLALASEPAPFPAKQLTYLICFDPGGQSDRVAHIQRGPLAELLGQKVVIEHKVGGGGAVGWRELVNAKPDGYLFGGFNIPHVILQPLQKDVGYQTAQIEPVAIFQRTPLALAVLKTSPINNLQDFLAQAKANPGKLTIGGSGSFSGFHMAALRLQKLGHVKLTYVPYTGSAPQMTAFLAGQVDAVFGASDDLTRFGDKVRILGFAMDQRFPAFPDAPTLREQGLDMIEVVDRGVAVPPGTPPAIIEKLERAFLQVAQLPEVREELTRQGSVPLAMGRAEAKAHLEKMTAAYAALAKEIEP